MKKKYNLYYRDTGAMASFVVDTEKFKKKDAQLLLDFFTWDYDKENNPIEELLKKYTVEIFILVLSQNLNISGVNDYFDNEEGLICLDGSVGVELIGVNKFSFNEEEFSILINE